MWLQAIFLFFLFSSSIEGVVIPDGCALNYTEKFNPQCQGFILAHPSIIYPNETFQVVFSHVQGSCCVYSQNVTLLSSSNDYCGNFNTGHPCITEGLHVYASNITQHIICRTGPAIGPASLIVGLTGLVSCTVNLNVTFSQKTNISVVDINTGDFLLMNDDGVVIVPANASINISCWAIPNDSYPFLNFLSFQPSSMISLPEIVSARTQNSVNVTAVFQDGFNSLYNGNYQCTSVHGYVSSLFIVSNEDLPTAYYPNGDTVNVFAGNSLNITAIIFTNRAIDPPTVRLIPTLLGVVPNIESFDNMTYYFTYASVTSAANGTYNLCFNIADTMGSGSGDSESLSVPECVPGQFTLIVTVPFFNPSPQPVYALLGGAVNMSCIPNYLESSVNWDLQGYEGFVSIDHEPEFVFTPVGLNHRLEFNLTSRTFDNSEYYSYDVDSGSYNQLKFRCSFGTYDNLINPTTVPLYIRQENIRLQNELFLSDIYNNSIVNFFNAMDEHKKRNVEHRSNFRAICTAVQGNNYPIFTVRLFSQPGVTLTIGNEDDSSFFSHSLNIYQQVLDVTVSPDVNGWYTCRSSLSSEVFLSFMIVSESPFIRATSSSVTALLGDNVNLTFFAAYNSLGDASNVYGLSGLFTSISGTNSSFVIRQSRSCSPCYEFSHTISSIRPEQAGTYTVSLLEASDTINVTVEVPQLIVSNESISLRAGDPLFISCMPSIGNFNITWYHNDQVISNIGCDQYDADPLCTQYDSTSQNILYLQSAQANDSGLYTCGIVVGDDIAVSRTISVNVTSPPTLPCFTKPNCQGDTIEVYSIYCCCTEHTYINGSSYNYGSSGCANCQPDCPQEYSSGVLWMQTTPGVVSSVSCASISDRFVNGLYVTRKCSNEGNWDEANFADCLLKEESTLIVWASSEDISDQFFSDRLNVTDIEYTIDSPKIYSLSNDVNLKIFYAYFPNNNASFVLSELLTQSQPENVLDNSNSKYRAGLQLFESSTSCDCQIRVNTIISLCTGASTRPCNCEDDNICECLTPFVGDGEACTLDSDGDQYPNVPLSTCTALDSEDTYCIQDNCVDVYNPSQDITACQNLTNTEFDGCPFGFDPVWNILWSNTLRNQTDRQPCPGMGNTLGFSTRMCFSNGTWGEPDLLNCLPVEYQNFLNTADSIRNSNESLDVKLQRSSELLSDLANASFQLLPNQMSQLPLSLSTSNFIIRDALDLLFESVNTTDESITNITNNLRILEIFDNLLNSTQVTGWQELWKANDTVNTVLGSDVLLQNAERYGLFLSLAKNETTVLRRRNIALRTKQYRVTDDEPLTFPQPGDLDDTSFVRRKAFVSIPSELLVNRKAGDTRVPVVSLLFQNLEDFIPATVDVSNDTQPGSLIWSGQVSLLTGNTDIPINLTFSVDNYTNASDYYCVYWNMERQQWADDGVVTLSNYTDSDGQVTVNCQSFHLTAFAVLVDVGGTIKQINPIEYTALQAVSYIGIAISIICLIFTVIFFLAQCKALFTSVHYFVHLNLAISLLLGYIVFAIGIETARATDGGCIFIAALLQYLFLSSFCWMMCEGIMLYLMLIVVFSTLAKRWYFFLILGWGKVITVEPINYRKSVPPLVPVVIGLAAGYSQYGVRNEYGDLLYCWLSTNQGVIWGFVVPMIVIIIINTVFLIMVLVKIWRTKSRQEKVQKLSKRSLVWMIVKGSIILLPLLGLTWLFGLLAVNQNTTVFAWIFTLLNTLQGAAIFFFQVIRSDKVWPKLIKSRLFRKVKTKLSLSTKSYEFSGDYSQSTSGSTVFKNSSSTLKMNTLKGKEEVYENDYSTLPQNFKNPLAVVDDEKKEKENESDLDEKMKEKEKEAFSTTDPLVDHHKDVDDDSV